MQPLRVGSVGACAGVGSELVAQVLDALQIVSVTSLFYIFFPAFPRNGPQVSANCRSAVLGWGGFLSWGLGLHLGVVLQQGGLRCQLKFKNSVGVKGIFAHLVIFPNFSNTKHS